MSELNVWILGFKSVMCASLTADPGGSLGFPYLVRNKDSWLLENLQLFEKKIEVINLLNMLEIRMLLFHSYFIYVLICFCGILNLILPTLG